MHKLIILAAIFVSQAACANGLITCDSKYSFDETLAKVEDSIADKNLSIFSKIDHKAGADGVGLDLRPTTLVIFGNPKAGTLLMQENQLVGLDLPLKILITEDVDHQVSVTYLDPEKLKEKFALEENDQIIGNIQKALGSIADSVQ